MHAFVDLQAFHRAAHDAHPDTRVYCLADHGGMPGLVRELDRAHIAWHSLFDGSSEEGALRVAPLLFSLDDAVEAGRIDLLGWVAEHGTYTSSMLLLASPLGMRELGARLARRLDATLPEGIEIMLRFFDPRVFEALIAVLDPAQKEAFLGVAACWWLLDRSGAVRAALARFTVADTFGAPLQLDARQEEALVAASEPDQVAARLAELAPAQFRALPHSERHDFFETEIGAARALGLASPHELVLYCTIALLEGRKFAMIPKWRDVLEAVRAGTITFNQAVAGMDG